MKKFLIALSIFAVALVAPVKSQTIVRLVQGTAADTLKKSETHYTSSVNVNFANTQIVSATIAIDSVSGAPGGTATLYQSVDGLHWNTTGSTATWKCTGGAYAWSRHNANGNTTPDTSFVLSLNPILGAYVKVGIVTNSTTQKSKYFVTVKSSNMY